MADKIAQVSKKDETDKTKKPAVKAAADKKEVAPKADKAKAPAASKVAKAPAAKKEAVAKTPAPKKEAAAKASVKKETAAKTPAEKKPDAKVVAAKTEPKKAAAPKAAPSKPVPAKSALKAPKQAKTPGPKRVWVSDGTVRGRLKARFESEVVPTLLKELNYKNVNEVPRLNKIVLNMRIGDIKDNSKSIQAAQKELDAIAGQRSVIVKAKKSVANFKLRENQPIGIKVTLRGAKMYEFFDKLVAIALPRVRDFRGVNPKSFDGRGNYALGVKEQIIFPEISYETVEKIRGFDVCVVTTAKNDADAKALLIKLGMPFKA